MHSYWGKLGQPGQPGAEALSAQALLEQLLVSELGLVEEVMQSMRQGLAWKKVRDVRP